ncbi:ethanolamine utilization protein [Brevibacillus fluminis]|uniref:Ethanolamine utilization protein n=1 Tax=Brevibacillus fluminis TaxID=511487 RepID=A0A3M8DSP1_9BACL|nr:ethanolamine ammonia-lyase reactivating factor EutA [Brevibacillus fluminis]RNB90499.1 ethanolamine utilization protein [Brevibacillus fluminis]
MEEQWITSVGIDLGTSTTKFIVSRLRLGRMSSTFSLPRFQIVERQLLYASPVYTTPLLDQTQIDAGQVFSLLQAEYRAAGITLADVGSGAVIITGETATKANAQQIVHKLAERAGDFVVATAGADLEGVLAGKGAGAETRSKEIRGVVANVDIGGGTANVAFFERGRVIATVTFHVGGRLIRLSEHGEIRYLSPHLKEWLALKGMAAAVGQTISFDELRGLTRALGESMLRYLAGDCETKEGRSLVFGRQLTAVPPIEEIMISGGVGQMMLQPPPKTMVETARHGDMGPLLAQTLKEELPLYSWRIAVPQQTVRATVIGAGMQATEISGSTVFLHPTLLPIKNVPVIKLDLEEKRYSLLTVESFRQLVEESMATASRLFEGKGPIAFALSGLPYCSYATLQLITEELANAFRRSFPDHPLFVVVCEHDMAKALGQSLSLRCKGKPNVICIDQVKVEHGDYIDLGEPISGTMIPVVIKTLAFADQEKG